MEPRLASYGVLFVCLFVFVVVVLFATAVMKAYCTPTP
jgi:Tfp pilus assembly protein PilX